MSKVKVPAVFDKWYKQLKQLENGKRICEASEAAIFLIGAQGHGYSVAGKNNIMKIDFDLTGYEENEMLHYISSNKVEAIRAILDGYEVEEQLYYIRIPHFKEGIVNYNLKEGFFFEADAVETPLVQTKFKMDFIENNIPELKQFAEKVEETDAR